MKYLHLIKVILRNILRYILRLLLRNPKYSLVLCLFVLVLTILHHYTNSTEEQTRTDPEEEIFGYHLNDSLSNSLSDSKHTLKMERYIRRWMAQNAIRGVSIAIMKDQKLVYCKGLGWADKELEIPVEAGNIFRIASASKLITAVGIMKLVDDGKLSLKDKVFGPYFYI